jgi:hypothetical protein
MIREKAAEAALKALSGSSSGKVARPPGPITPTSMKIASAAKKALQRLGPRKETILTFAPDLTQHPDDNR